MLALLVIWLILDLIALLIISYRVDAAAHYDVILSYIHRETVIECIIGAVVLYAVLALTIPANIIKIFKE